MSMSGQPQRPQPRDSVMSIPGLCARQIPGQYQGSGA